MYNRGLVRGHKIIFYKDKAKESNVYYDRLISNCIQDLKKSKYAVVYCHTIEQLEEIVTKCPYNLDYEKVSGMIKITRKE